jgi:hypothetical protein
VAVGATPETLLRRNGCGRCRRPPGGRFLAQFLPQLPLGAGRRANGSGASRELLACPCCRHRTLEARGAFEICAECGWEDDGQDDHNADVVRGGPNGRLSLTQARLDYAEVIAQDAGDSDGAAVSSGGQGRWWTAARQQIPELDE